jgi:hypothetical protein
MTTGRADTSGMMKSGKPDRAPDGGSPDRTQRNFSNPDSHIQPTRSSAVIAGYAQIAAASAHQNIVDRHLQTSRTEARAPAPLLTDIRAMLRTNPKEVPPRPATATRRASCNSPAVDSPATWPRPGARQPSECRRPSTMAQGLAQGRHGDKTQALRKA